MQCQFQYEMPLGELEGKSIHSIHQKIGQSNNRIYNVFYVCHQYYSLYSSLEYRIATSVNTGVGLCMVVYNNV